MRFNWDSYIDLCREFEKETDTAKIRCAVSRGYYGVYHKTKIKLGYNTPNHYIKHERVISELLTSGKFENGALLSNKLQKLKESREDADYKSFVDVNQLYLTRFIINLDSFIENMENDEN